VRSATRHQLKQNSFAETTVETISWAVEHQSKLIVAAIIVVIVAALALGGWAFINYRNQQASQELAGALVKYQAPIRPAGEPPTPEMLSYASAAERAKAANADFTRIADKQLQQVAGGQDKEVASLAKLALASIYENTNRTQQAIELYKGLMAKPTTSVGKTTAQFELATLYENNHQPLEARKIYEQMQKDYPASPIGQLASQKLQTLHP